MKETKRFDLSVIIPVYNTERYLKDTMDSILRQKDIDLEIIFIDDESSDLSFEILNSFKAQYENVVVLSQKHSGQSRARNMGISYATGDYIMFLDSDDCIEDNTLHSLYVEAKRNDLQLLLFDTRLDYDNEKLKENQDAYYKRRNGYECITRGRQLFSKMMIKSEFIDSASLMLIQTEWLKKEEITFYPNIYYEDSLFIIRCMYKAERVKHVPIIGYRYRIRDNSTMTTEPTLYNVKSKIVVFTELLKILLSVEDENEEEALIKYLNQVVNGIFKYERERNDKKQKIMMDSGLESLFFKVFRIGSIDYTNEAILLNGLNHMLNTSESIYIYGNGIIGNLMYNYLKKTKIDNKFKGFIVTEFEEENCISDKCIIPVNEIQYENQLILLSARKDYRFEMEDILLQRGIHNFLHIDANISNAIKNYLRRNNYE